MDAHLKKDSLVLVTGGAGFVGSHLCERLVAEGHRVISLDNYFTGTRENHISGVEYREGHTEDIARHIPESPDVVFHLGEYSRIAKSLEEPEVVFDLNTLGTFGVLEFWRKRGGKLVYAGSSTKFTAAREDGLTGRELSPYSWSKAANSELVHGYGRWYSLPYAIAYFYNVYGPRERSIEQYGTVIETFRQCAVRGEPLPVRSPGTQKRAFTHVDDTVNALILIAKKGGAEEYAISAKETYSLLDVAKLYGGNVAMLPQTTSSRSSEADDTTLLQNLGWKQTRTLEEYIATEIT